jgi:hypothetical protein
MRAASAGSVLTAVAGRGQLVAVNRYPVTVSREEIWLSFRVGAIPRSGMERDEKSSADARAPRILNGISRRLRGSK